MSAPDESSGAFARVPNGDFEDSIRHLIGVECTLDALANSARAGIIDPGLPEALWSLRDYLEEIRHTVCKEIGYSVEE